MDPSPRDGRVRDRLRDGGEGRRQGWSAGLRLRRLPLPRPPAVLGRETPRASRGCPFVGQGSWRRRQTSGNWRVRGIEGQDARRRGPCHGDRYLDMSPADFTCRGGRRPPSRCRLEGDKRHAYSPYLSSPWRDIPGDSGILPARYQDARCRCRAWAPGAKRRKRKGAPRGALTSAFPSVSQAAPLRESMMPPPTSPRAMRMESTMATIQLVLLPLT